MWLQPREETILTRKHSQILQVTQHMQNKRSAPAHRIWDEKLLGLKTLGMGYEGINEKTESREKKCFIPELI